MQTFLRCFLLYAIVALYWLPVKATDNCNTATTLTVQPDGCATPVSGTTVGATKSTQDAFIPIATDDDVWYQFTTPAGASPDTRFTVILQLSDLAFTGTAQDIYLERREGAADKCANYFPEFFYFPKDITERRWVMTGLTPLTEYSIRLYTDGTTSRVAFKICLFMPPPPANDNCETATSLTPVLNGCNAAGPFNTITATASPQPSGDGTGRDDDVWFTFTTLGAPAKYKVTISNIEYNTGFGNIVIETWDACGAVERRSFNPYATTADMGVLPANTAYKIRVYTYGTTSRLSKFSICINAINPPVNDVCAGALPIEVGEGAFGAPINASTLNAGEGEEDIGSCDGYPDDDIWYRFVAPASGMVEVKIENVTVASGFGSPVMATLVHGGTCDATTVAGCGTGNLNTFMALTPGATYLLRFMTVDIGDAANFTVSMRQVVAPPNDNCSGAIQLPVNTDQTYRLQQTATTFMASPSGLAPTPCVPAAQNDVWFRFTAPETGAVQLRYFNVTNPQGGSNAIYTILYGGECAAPVNLRCVTFSNDVLTGLTPGTEYRLRVMSNAPNQYLNFTIALRAVLGMQDNGNCAGARTLTTTWQRGSTIGQPMANTVTACYGSIAPNRVTYYQFTATATTHYLDFTELLQLSPNSIGLGYRVYSAPCDGNPVAQSLKCIASVRMNNEPVTGLTVGQTYFVQIMENTFNGGPVEFSLRLAPNNAVVWLGTADTNWNNAANWSSGTVPAADHEAIIPGGRPRYPLVSGNITVRRMKIDQGATVNVAAGANVLVLE